MSQWREKRVLVTGGSQGLGFSIARAFGKQGAKVILWARDSERLRTAVERLHEDQIEASYETVDVLDAAAVNEGMQTIEKHYGRLDVLVNAVGKSTRIPLGEASLETYQEFMRLNFETAVQCSLTAMPLLEKTGGHLVNIGSLSSKTAWPYMAPYTASKFALAGFTQQCRLEGPSNVHTMLVCPGPIRRTDAGSRYARDGSNVPQSAAKPGGGAPVKGLSPERVANLIVRGCQRRTAELILPAWLRCLFSVSACSASLGDWILKRVAPQSK